MKKSPIGNRDYPLTWEQRAGQAKYANLTVLDRIYADQNLSTRTPDTRRKYFIFAQTVME